MSKPRGFWILVCLLLAIPTSAFAQSATTGTVLGTVRDPQDAVVVGAEVTLENAQFAITLKQKTNESGQYVFPAVPPGTYTITVQAPGFRTQQIPALKVDVAKSYTVNIQLELGEIAEVVKVEATAQVELQTTDAAVGNVIAGRELPRMPTLTRRANELLMLQPLVENTGAVAGARQDQTTFSLDGIDVTNQIVGGTGTFIPIPTDVVEEFRVAVTNPNAQFGRGGGGQVTMVTKAGTTEYHGVAFWYHQNDNLNANTWDRNRRNSRKPELKDNRFGFNIGGPVPAPWFYDRTFLFAYYEGRRFPRTTEITRLVPTATLRQGILQFRDATDTVRQYNLATAAVCGATQNLRCDPRGRGLSPTISALWALLPAGNDPSQGDGLNTIGFRDTISNSLDSDYYHLRLDHKLTSNWTIEGSFRYFGEVSQGANLVDIRGGEGKSFSREAFPNRQNFAHAAIRGQITPNLSGDFRFGWNRSRTATDRFRPNQTAALLALPGTNTPDGFIALDIGARGGTQSLLSEPIDVGTQVARKQISDQRNFQWNGDLIWVRGSHIMKFGSHVRYLPFLHLRDDKVLGSLGALVAQIDSDLGVFTLPATNRPPTCGGTITTNCLRTADVQQWNRLYAGMTGMIDNVSVMAVWDGSFNPLPFGELLVSDTTSWAPEFYFEDSWRITSSLTFTYGLNYGWQTSPKEKLGRQSFQVDAITLEVITAEQYFRQRLNAALRGNIFNPNFAFLPINSSTRSDIIDVDWNNLAPNVALAWSPSFRSGWLGWLFGDRKTALRGGYRLAYDRLNTVQTVIVPALGIAFAQTINVSAPLCNSTGPGGAGCNPSSTNPAESVFRIGIDGTIPRPTVPNRTIPVSPFWGIDTSRPGCSAPGANGLFASACLSLFPEILSFQMDPDMVVPYNHMVDFTWQRELPWNMLVEFGYVGRFARKLMQSMNVGQAPYIHVDPISGQSFAQAFDAVALALRAGTAIASLPRQPWFENNIPAASCAAFPNCTQFIASVQLANFINGNVSSLFLRIDQERLRARLVPFVNLISQTQFLRSSTGRSNYNAFFVALNKRMSHGLQFALTYTLSKSLDQIGAIQNAASVMPNNFFLDAEYGPSGFDNTHIFNGTYLYELPFGRGRWLGVDNSIIDRIINGWYVSGIFTARSGDPLIVTQGTQVWGGTLFLGFATGAIPTVDPSTFGNSAVSGVAGSGGVGTTGNPATGGSGLNLFRDPEAVFKSFRRIELSRDGRSGRANPLRGMPRWNLDMSIGKRTHIAERVSFVFSFDFFNIFNHLDFANPGLSLTAPQAFGVISSQLVPANRTEGARWIQFGARIEF